MAPSRGRPAGGLTIEAIVAVESAARVPPPPARPGRRLHRRGRRRAPAVHAVAARRLPDPADRVGEGRLGPAVVARRPPPRLRPRRRDLGRRGRRVALDPRRRQARRRPCGRAGRPTAVASRSCRGGAAGRRSGSSTRRSRAAAARPTEPKPPTPTRPDRGRHRRRRVRVVARRRAHRGHAPGCSRTTPRPPRSPSSTSRRGALEVVAGETSLDAGPRWVRRRVAALRLGRGRLVPGRPPLGRRPRPDRPDRRRARARRAVRAASGSAPLPSPDGSRFVHIEVHDGLLDLVVGDLAGAVAPKRGRGRPPKTPRTVTATATGQRDQPVGRRLAVGRLDRGRGLGRRHRRERDAAAGPVAAAGARASPARTPGRAR